MIIGEDIPIRFGGFEMVITRILVLLEKHSQSLINISEILKGAPERIDKYICSNLEIDLKEFITDVKIYGINRTSVELWDMFLRTYGFQIVCSAVASELIVKKDHIESSRIVFTDIIPNLANEMAVIRSFRNSYMIATIQKVTREVTNRYSSAIKKEIKNKNSYSGKIRSGEVNTVLTSGLEEFNQTRDNSIRVRDEMKKINGSNFEKILYDIYNVTELMCFESSDASIESYTLFGCFINQFSSVLINDINKAIQPHLVVKLDNTSSSDRVRKYKKYDTLMSLLLPYIMGEINSSNISAIASKVCEFLFYQNNSQVTFFTKDVPITTEEAKYWSGNFNLEKRFQKPEHAVNFTTFMIGILALHKLYKYLEDFEISLLTIDPDVFKFENPSSKFSNLYELVKYSKRYCDLRRLYFKDRRFGSVVDTEILDDNISYPKLRRLENNYPICMKRINKILLDDWGDIPVTGSASYLLLNLKTIIEFLYEGYHPLLPVLNIFTLDSDIKYLDYTLRGLETEEDIVLESGYIEDYDDDTPDENGEYPNYLALEVEEYSEELTILIEDLYPLGLGDNSIVNTVMNIIYIFEGIASIIEPLVISSNAKYVSQFEISLACSKSILYQKFDSVPDSLTGVTRSILLLNIILDAIEKDLDLIPVIRNDYEFLFLREYSSAYMTNLIVAISNALDSVYDLVSSTRQTLDHLLDVELTPPVNGNRLAILYKELNKKVDMDSFARFIRIHGYSRDESGYLVDANEQYVTKSFGNKLGFLHSMAMYVFVDCTAQVWGE